MTQDQIKIVDQGFEVMFTTGFKVTVELNGIAYVIREGHITTMTDILMELDERHFKYHSKTTVMEVSVFRDGFRYIGEEEIIGETFDLQLSGLFDIKLSLDLREVYPFLECLFGIQQERLSLSFQNSIAKL